MFYRTLAYNRLKISGQPPPCSSAKSDEITCVLIEKDRKYYNRNTAPRCCNNDNNKYNNSYAADCSKTRTSIMSNFITPAGSCVPIYIYECYIIYIHYSLFVCKSFYLPI